MEYTEDIEIYYFLLAGTLAMFLLSAGIVGFVILYQRKLHQAQLELQEMETMYQKNLVQSNMEEIENERIRISKDLHDEIGSLFSALSIKLDQLVSTIPPSQLIPESNKVIKDSKQTIELGIKSIRRISHNMIPPTLEMFGLVVTLEDLCSQFEGGPSGLPIEFTASENIAEPPNKISLIIFRIIQELIQNTLRHSGATRAELSIKNKENNIILEYADNGKGFLYDEMKKNKGLGLLNIESRVSIIQATLNYETAPNMGTKVIITIPNLNLTTSHEKKH
jgi:two-component system NarL family sensor kinase